MTLQNGAAPFHVRVGDKDFAIVKRPGRVNARHPDASGRLVAAITTMPSLALETVHGSE